MTQYFDVLTERCSQQTSPSCSGDESMRKSELLRIDP